MVTPAGDELVVRVRLDGKRAERDSAQIAERSAKKVNKAVTGGLRKNLVRGLAGTLGFFFGGLAVQGARELVGLGNIIGRGTGLGGKAGQFFGGLEAQRTAIDQTVAAFGLAGGKRGEALDPEAVLGLFKQLRTLEEMRTGTEARIRNILGAEVRDETVSGISEELQLAAKNLGLAAQELSKIVTGGRLR